MLTTIIIFILTLAVLILSHEFGHFITAKKFGVKVLEFGFGLPPRIFGKKIGETIYSLNLLPIGGFVRLFGEDETDKKVLENERSFASHPVWQRIIIVVAGVVMNLILAVAIFWAVLAAQGFKEKIPLLTPYRFVGITQQNETLVLVGDVANGSPAQAAGLRAGDRIVEFNGHKLSSAEELINLTKENLGKKVSLDVVSTGDSQNLTPEGFPTGKFREVQLVPRENPPKGQGALGVEVGGLTFANISYPTPLQKAGAGFIHSYNIAVYSFTILGNLISQSIATKNVAPVSSELSGPVGITSIANSILQTSSPLLPYLDFVALLSLNLAIFNILPIPALDGGRMVFLIVEAVFRRKVRADVEKWVHTLGFAILITLLILITFSDIRKLF